MPLFWALRIQSDVSGILKNQGKSGIPMLSKKNSKKENGF